MLQAAGVVAVIGKFETAGMAQHVWVNWEWQECPTSVTLRSRTESRRVFNVRRWSGYPHKLSVKTDINSRRPCAITGLMHCKKNEMQGLQ
jgi:hypothetical protein